MKTADDLEKSLTTEFATIWRVLKAANTELEVYKNAITSLLGKQPELTESLNAYLTSARQSPALPAKMNDKYARVLGTLIQKFLGDLPPKVLEQLKSLENLD